MSSHLLLLQGSVIRLICKNPSYLNSRKDIFSIKNANNTLRRDYKSRQAAK